jgi:phage-related protein (TIGR01555 family)
MPKSNKPIVGTRQDGGRMPVVQNRPGQYLRRADGWNNFLAAAGWNNKNTGRGVQGIDKRMDTKYNPKAVIEETTLRALYRGDGTARRIIDLAVEAMTSQGFEIMGDPEGMVVARMEETGIIKAFEELLRWARLFGGALGVINADDGQLYEKPLNFQGIRKVYDIRVYNRWRITFSMSDLYRNPAHPKFGKPEFYWVQPLMGVRYRVHESRTIRIDGAPVDDLTALQNQGWGDSILQACFDSLASFSAVHDSVEAIIDDFITSTISIKELSELMAAPGGERLVLKRLALMEKAKAVTNTRILDADSETFAKVASSVAGLADLMDRYANKLALDSGYPVTLLMGQAPAGLSATGDADKSNFYDKMEAEQHKTLRPSIEYVTRLIFLSSDDYFNGTEPANWWVEFNKLWQPTAKEKVELEKVQVDTMDKLVAGGVMSPDEVRDQPEIRKRYNLKGDAPEPEPTPEELAAEGEGGEGDDEADDQAEPGDKEKPKPKEKRDDSLPADPVQARADMMGACRFLLRDTRGRRRGDAAKFLEQTVILQRSAFDSADQAARWVKAHGFRADNMQATMLTYRFSQRDRLDFVPRSEKTITPITGVEITLGRVKDA